jgi:small subunit ribosomal protein S18
MYPERSYKSRDSRDSRDRRDKKDDLKKRVFRKKVCRFCLDKVTNLDYKDSQRLLKFVTERGKIVPSRISGNCAIHQRMITKAIKRARQVALLPFSAE